MQTATSALGGNIMCAASREAIAYQSTHFQKATPLAVSLIADTVANAQFTPEEVEAQREAARYEIREFKSKPETYLPEVLHHVAYNGQTLGTPLFCPEERVDSIDTRLLLDTKKDWYRPERMVIAGSGIDHQELVELAEKHFSSFKYTPPVTAQLNASTRPSPTQAPISPHILTPSQPPSLYKSMTRAASYLYNSGVQPQIDALRPATIPRSPVNYAGGHQFIHDPSVEFDHLYLAFEGSGIHDQDIYALATIQLLLGGGGSFSAGGPGKGMYSRLYTHILNHYAQIDHCTAFHHIYTDSSLFGLFASFLPNTPHSRGNTAKDILPHLAHQLSLLLYTPIPTSELNRAKNQLKSSMVMALESKSLEVEDLGRQVRLPSIYLRDYLTNTIRIAPGSRSEGPSGGNVREDRRSDHRLASRGGYKGVRL
jgi:processing peptidase subunit alpha